MKNKKRTKKGIRRNKNSFWSYLQKRKSNTTKKRGSNKSSNQVRRPDPRLVSLVAIFTIAGVIMIFSASAAQTGNNPDFGFDSFYFVKRQILWIFIGVLAATFLYFIPIEAYRALSAPMLAVGIVLLMIIIPEALFGVDIPFVLTKNGATRWLGFGSFDVQPAEFIKFAFVVYLSAWLTRSINKGSKKKEISSDEVVTVVLPFIFLIGLIGSLVLAQKDLDTTVIIVLTILTVYYIAGTNAIHTATVVSILIFSVFFGAFAISQEDYRRSRVTSWWEITLNGEPSAEGQLDESFQNWNGIIAIASGGIFGRGFNESRYKLGFLQEAAYTDSIFAVIGEEFGLVGAILIILGFLYFASIGFDIAQKAPNKFAALMATGMTSWIIIQAFLNIAANLGVIPFGGMPLPFFSYGGSGTVTIFMAIGVILNVSKYSTQPSNKRIDTI